jgi:hypothetical protein
MRFVVLLICVAATACTSSPANPGSVDAQFTLAPGQQTHLGSGAVAIRFVGVTSDSRCPAAAICVWSGDAAARFEIGRGGNAEPLDLHTTLQPNRGQASGFTVHLLELAPYPIQWDSIRPADYRATVRVTR